MTLFGETRKLPILEEQMADRPESATEYKTDSRNFTFCQLISKISTKCIDLTIRKLVLHTMRHFNSLNN